MMELHYTLLGLAVGILVGITGVGGGSLVTPVLTLFGVVPAVAAGTDIVRYYHGITGSHVRPGEPLRRPTHEHA
ncbi:MAG: hypothetical protein Q7R45_05295 [Sulfuricaulis sp.]|nr:hypothetical protein [Sulfuricaulis sp.]